MSRQSKLVIKFDKNLVNENCLSLPSSNKENTRQAKTKNHVIFPERNLIKKVKTFCMNYFLYLVQNCLETPKLFSLYNMKNKKKRQVFRVFKSDISKMRNYVLLNIPMKIILDSIAAIPWTKIKVREDKLNAYNYFLNMTWSDLILYCKRNVFEKSEIKITESANLEVDGDDDSKSEAASEEEKTGVKKNKFIRRKMALRDFNEYLMYISQADYNYNNRVNVDKNYLKLFELLTEIQETHLDLATSLLSHENVVGFIFSENHNCAMPGAQIKNLPDYESNERNQCNSAK